MIIGDAPLLTGPLTSECELVHLGLGEEEENLVGPGKGMEVLVKHPYK